MHNLMLEGKLTLIKNQEEPVDTQVLKNVIGKRMSMMNKDS